ncbi:hypothetical protein N7540_003361 [Penicillium herquei]|nr:hypothetical protein N7540_003361 [Penicillium herquei]
MERVMSHHSRQHISPNAVTGVMATDIIMISTRIMVAGVVMSTIGTIMHIRTTRTVVMTVVMVPLVYAVVDVAIVNLMMTAVNGILRWKNNP